MPVLTRDLLAAPALGLRPLTSHCWRPDRSITWVSTTELPDPLPFLGGGELVMTTGMLERADEDWRDLVQRLADLPVAALCFGVGLVHQGVPDALVSAAEASGLALVSSPVEVPFVQISRWVADRLFAEQYDAVQTMVNVQDQLVQELLSHNGLRGLLRRLHQELQCGAVAVLASDGRVVDRYPRRGEGEPPPAVGVRTDATRSAPIVVDDVPVATLCTQEPTGSPQVLAFAATILGLEVARQQAVLTGRRELLGQVLEDVLHRTASEADAKRRLATYGIAAEDEHAMVVARVSGPTDRLRRLPWTLGTLLERSGDRLPTALIDDSVVVIVPPGVDAGHAADAVAGHLALIDSKVRVGVGEPRRGVSGLRLGYFEARQAAQGGPGVHRAAPLSVTGLLLGNLDLPLQELGQGVLAPLLAHDARGGGELVTTLRAYLANDCQPAATAAELVLHRNSLRYRLDLIERLTGRDLDRLNDRIELWLALAAYDAG